ncbi:CUB and sushi domain-containing protein 3-like isoform X1 [Halichondria panicea]|uniref:CUB and sushi domain-containing protein 3-like isoform X1 n=2 Tax=Halichondria panicea TaxID=6063 RepID=UPI00312B61E7
MCCVPLPWICTAPCPTLPPLTNGSISYNPTTNMATYSCVTGYTISGATPITCTSDGTTSAGTWSPTPPTVICTIVTCPVLTSPTNGALSTTSQDYLTVVIYSCDTGYIFTGNSGSARTCQATGLWSEEVETCPPVDCGSLGHPSNGTTFNRVATYTCTSGYMISGATNTRTCQATGSWSPSQPTCEPVDCNDLPDPSNGAVSTSSGTTFRMTATYTCNSRYLLIGDTSRTCQATGWSDNAPTCLLTCFDLGNQANSDISYNGGTSNLRPPDTVAIYTCVNGYKIDGTASDTMITRSCHTNGLWSGTTPSCELICPTFPNPTNGVIQYSDSIIPRATASTASYSCTAGYLFSGTAMRTCTTSGWSNSTTPTCTATCDDLTVPNNGTISYNPISSPRLVGAVSTHSCAVTGYQPSNGPDRVCQSDRMWSGGVITCQIISCGSLSISNGAVDTSSGVTFGNTATYSCNGGHILVGSNTRTCEANGNWSPGAPTCLAIQVVISPSGIPMAGQSFSLTCSLTGGASLQPTLSYQWTREGGSLMPSTATLNFDSLYLSDAGQYSCQVILTSSQLEGEHTVAAHYTIEFMSMHIQIRLEGITNCRVYTEQDAGMKTDDITNSLTQGIESQCACGFNSSLVLNPFIICFDDSPSHVTYRAVLTGTESISTIQLARLMEQ